MITIVGDSQSVNIPESIELIHIPKGIFLSGETNIEKVIDYDYLIMKYPVTNLLYIDYLKEAFSNGQISIDTTGVYGIYDGDKFWPPGIYKFADFSDEFARNGFFPPDIFITKWRYVENRQEYYYDHPITHVTWFGANAFAKYYGMRLPSSDEWQKAARGNSEIIYPWGSNLYSNISNYKDSGDPYDNDTTPVWYYNGRNNTIDSTSPYGIYDLAGNTWEWTASWWRDSSGKIIKGGSFNSSLNKTESGALVIYELMSWFEPAVGYLPENISREIGFRCVKDIND